MYHLCICQLPGNPEVFKGHGLASLGGLMDWATVGGLSVVKDFIGGEVQKCEDMIGSVSLPRLCQN